MDEAPSGVESANHEEQGDQPCDGRAGDDVHLEPPAAEFRKSAPYGRIKRRQSLVRAGTAQVGIRHFVSARPSRGRWRVGE